MDFGFKKPVIFGFGGGFLLFGFYFLFLTLANSFSHAVSQFSQLWYWILALILGFGVQVGLYVYIRYQINELRNSKKAGGVVAATASMSAVSMVACCAHHFVEILAFLGLAAVSLFFVQYQTFFIIAGVVSNIIGIIFMLEIIKKHNLYSKETVFFQWISKFNIKNIRNLAITLSVLVMLVAFSLVKESANQITAKEPIFAQSASKDLGSSGENKKISLLEIINEEGGLSIGVQPINFSFGKPLEFKVSFDTHSGDLSFDLTKKSVLIDDRDNKYLPLKWEGATGGHHISGILTFSKVEKDAKKIRLIISDVYGVKERDFLWALE